MELSSTPPTALRSHRNRWLAATTAVLVGLAVAGCSSDDNGSTATSSPATAAPTTTASTTSPPTTDSATEAELAAANARADEAEGQLAKMQAMFPITVDGSIDNYDLVGGYTMTLTQAYCDGLPDCGVPRPAVHADIIQGPQGLQLQVPNVLTAGLFAVNGSLFAVTDSDLIANPCGQTPRNSRVSITMFAGGFTVASDGTQKLTGLGASLLVEVNPVANCGEGVIFFAATLTPDA
jgi:hypothetical protein